jgi:Ser/Thr protein kinase RdoA (MazF antagonist)
MATGTSADEAVRQVAAHWGWQDAELARISGGLINQTFGVRQGGAPIAVLQQLHPIFGAEVNLDLEAVTAHLAARNLITPRLWRTVAGDAWATDGEAKVWRALTWVEGLCVARVPDGRWAEAGGELVGRFHRAVADLRHAYRFSRGNVHDTPRHFARLRRWLAGEEGPLPAGEGTGEGAPAGAGDGKGAPLLAEAIDVAQQILDAAAALPVIPVTAQRHCHGDLKISNLLFDLAQSAPMTDVRGVCLLDLDTLCLGTIAFELGDAMRSWCNPAGEDVTAAAFDLSLFDAAMRGYRGVADPLLSDDERVSIVSGLHTVCVELAARFCIDVFEDRYFGWNAAAHPSRRHHNLVRARSQLSLARSVASQREEALAIVMGRTPR